jgi:hypothetical protein
MLSQNDIFLAKAITQRSKCNTTYSKSGLSIRQWMFTNVYIQATERQVRLVVASKPQCSRMHILS